MKINRQTYKAIAISLVTCSLILTSPRDASAIQLPVPAELSGLITQVNQLITSINSGDFLKAQLDKALGQYLPQVQAAITQSIGQLLIRLEIVSTHLVVLVLMPVMGQALLEQSI